jgi:hypothetical protein
MKNLLLLEVQVLRDRSGWIVYRRKGGERISELTVKLGFNTLGRDIWDNQERDGKMSCT